PRNGPPARQSRLLTTDVPASVRSACRSAAREISTPVFCPPLVPRGFTRVQVAFSSESLYDLNFESKSVAGFDPEQPRNRRRHLGHWLVQGGRPADLLNVLRTNSPFGIPPPTASLTADGVEVKVYEISGYQNLHQGHVVAVWRFGDEMFDVSMHGFQHRRLVLEMARALINETVR
ncbi:MAG: hypothetical protein ACRDKV_10185, partial [Solirubrobacterales bacterium]